MTGAAPPRRCAGAVLAGGRATRFAGRPKGLEVVGGARIVDRVAAALRATTDELLLVVADGAAAAGWLPDARIAADLRPGIGSLGGVHAALGRSRGADVLVVAWDMPFVPVALLAALRARGEATDVDAVLPESDAPGGVEPLCAWYSARALDAVERLIASGERRVGALASIARVVRLPREEVARFGDPATMFLNVNSAAELARAQALVAGRGMPE